MNKETKRYLKAIGITIGIIAFYYIACSIFNFFVPFKTNYWHMVICYLLIRSVLNDLER